MSISPARISWRDGLPYALDFDDWYFNTDGGLGESRHVFLGGNQLPDRWLQHRFSIGETGFGTGLNLLVVLSEFERSPWEFLDYWSIELFPLCHEDLVRSHAYWPEFASLGRELQAIYPPLEPALHQVTLPRFRLRLNLVFADVASGLDLLPDDIDAWFLDGFAPKKNPGMWSPALFRKLARHTCSGGSFATFTAAGDVRRGLEAAGFETQRPPGFGKKRHMLCGRLPLIPRNSAS